jgi:integrase
MRGHVRKRGAKWAIVLDVGNDPETGRRKQRWHSGFERKRDAERALADLLAKQQRGEYVEPSRLTVRGYLTGEWLPAVHRSVRPLTYAGYERSVRIHIVPRIGDLALQRVTPAKLNGLYSALLDHGRADGQGLAPGSVRQVHLALHGALRAAVRWQLLNRNAAAFADPPRVASPTMRVWTADELGRFLSAIRDNRLYPLFLVLAGTGMRRGEALGARWEDLDLEGARWQVRRTLLPASGGSIEGTPKTARGHRSVALDPGTVRALRAWRTHQLEERMAWGVAWTDSGRVFTREDGTDLHPARVSELFDRLVKQSGVPRIRLHDLRHGHCTLALAAGVHPKVVQERLGHSSVAFTLDRYSHVVPAMQEDAAETVARLVGLSE